MARLGAFFDADPDLGVVWGLVQRFHAVFCAETDEDAERALDWFTDAYLAAGINLARPSPRSAAGAPSDELPQGEPGNQRTIGGREHPHRAGAHIAYGFASRNYRARVLLFCSGHPPALAG